MNSNRKSILDILKNSYPKAYDKIKGLQSKGYLKNQSENEILGNYIIEVIEKETILSKDQRDKLKELYPHDFLTFDQNEKLKEIVSKNKNYLNHLKFKGGYTSEEEREISKNISEKIHGSLPEEEQKIYSINAINETIKYIPIMNLGIIERLQNMSSGDFIEYYKENRDVFGKNIENTARILTRYFVKKGEMKYNGNLEGWLKEVEQELNDIERKNGK